MQGSTLVEWDEAPGFARLKRAKGDVLMCQARPTTDCVLRVPANLVADPGSATLPRHRRGRIGAARRLVRDVIEIDIALSQPVTFDAGQFVVLEVPGLEGGRAYSMVNFRRDSDRLTFVIKQKPGGGFSDWLFGSEVTGAELDMFGPLGAATFRPAEGRNLLCIAGGSGIAGMLSILEHARSENYFRDHSGHVFFGVRASPTASICRSCPITSPRRPGKLHVTLALSHEPAQGAIHPQFPHIRLATGMVTDVMAHAMAGHYDGTVSLHRRPDADGRRGLAHPHPRRPPARRLRAV